jgi:thymidine phosphorylase
VVAFTVIMSRMFVPEKLIDQKRRGLALSHTQINHLVEGIASGAVTDAQLGALTMAVRFNGMEQDEQTSLTLAMRDSGSVLHWEGLNGPVLDKHSTGGVGDWVSLALAPIVAACGGYIPMISGRGLGHTGGTLDKLESIPGYKVQMDLDQLQDQVRRTGMAMVGQGPELAPADGRMYAVRDVTATVESIPLIVSSILSKKLAEGLDGLVPDVKSGNGAFLSKPGEALELARNLCITATRAGVKCNALVTDMNQPLGWTAGNTLELNEAIDFLTGLRRNPRLEEVTLSLVAEMLSMGGLAKDRDEGRKQANKALDNGDAAERFAQNIFEQGGPVDLFEKRDDYLYRAPVIRPYLAPKPGWISEINTRELGIAVLRLGGGRLHVADTIDPRVGLSDLCSVGDRVETGKALCMIHADSEEDWKSAAARIGNAMSVSDQNCSALPAIYERISGELAET